MSSNWDPKRYQNAHSYVWQYGEDLLELLEPRSGERILDLGCGTGQLTAAIAKSGATVIGLDSSPQMLDQARRNYPELSFVLGDAARFHFPTPFDAVFSNAVLHWVKDLDTAVGSIAQALRTGGRFVAECGGQGNTTSILGALRAVLGAAADERCPWRFPSVGEFTLLLEGHGLEVHQVSLFDRPTKLEGENGMEDWLRMFCAPYFSDLPGELAQEKIRETVEQLRSTQYHDGVWTIDYRRLRVVAVK